MQSGADLALLTRDDCKELGFSIGERNRVADWAARVVRLSIAIHSCYGGNIRLTCACRQGPKRRRVSGEWDVGVLTEKVGSLEESVAQFSA